MMVSETQKHKWILEVGLQTTDKAELGKKECKKRESVLSVKKNISPSRTTNLYNFGATITSLPNGANSAIGDINGHSHAKVSFPCEHYIVIDTKCKVGPKVASSRIKNAQA
jgi:hypothetical protein